MRAVWLREFGPPSVLVAGEAHEPVAGPGQVVIDVEYANITFVETQFRATGKGPFAGDAADDPGQRRRRDGRRAARDRLHSAARAAYAERVAVDAAALFDVPDGMALDHAVALLADGRTATMLTARRGDRARRARARRGRRGRRRHAARPARQGGGRDRRRRGRQRGQARARRARSAPTSSSTTRAPAGPPARSTSSSTASAARSPAPRSPSSRAGGRMLSYGLASGSWAGIDAEEAAARGVALVQPDRSPAALRAAPSARSRPAPERSSASASRSNGPPTPTPRSSPARRSARPCSR